jgi:hypothetical protein
MQVAKPVARLDPQRLDQRRSGRLIGLERLTLPAAAVEREHQQTVEALSARGLADERFQLTDDLGVPAAMRQVGVDPLLHRRHPQLFEPRDLGLGEPLVGQVGERRAAPDRQRLAQGRRRARRLLPRGLREQALEARCVELRRRDLEQVAGRASEQTVVSELLAQP